MAWWFRKVRLLVFSLLWQQATGLCSSSPLAESPSQCPERPRGWMMCPHSMASCRIWVFSQYRFASDTIYKSRTGVLTPRSCLVVLSFIIIILITKCAIWLRLWSLAQTVTVQYSDSCSADDRPWRNAPCFRRYFEEQTLTWTVRSGERVGPVQLEVGQGLFLSSSWWNLD